MFDASHLDPDQSNKSAWRWLAVFAGLIVFGLILSRTGLSKQVDRALAARATLAYFGNPGKGDEIYVINPDILLNARLTDSGSAIGGPIDFEWSPDGAQIVYENLDVEAHTTQLFVMNADGTGQRALTDISLNAGGPDWSPDGRRIIFSVGKPPQDAIAVINAEGSGLTRLTDDSGNYGAQWSPDGRQILFNSLEKGQRGLHVMDADGSNQRALANPSDIITGGVWSPDGSHILFVGGDADSGNLYLMDMATGQPDRLTASGQNGLGSWSPDGKWIVFGSGRDGNPEIYIMKPDGSRQTNLTRSAAVDETPAWSPDGEWIAFTSNRNGPYNQIFIMRPDGSGLRQVTHGINSETPRWRPSNK